MMPVGYEFGFRKQVNVVETQPSDWERKHFDLRTFITTVNRVKLRTPVLQGEGVLRAPAGLGGDVLVLQRFSERAGDSAAWILVNTRTDRSAGLDFGGTPLEQLIGYRMLRVCRPLADEQGEEPPRRLDLDPAEVVYLLPA
jgi:starch synthase (maltosyl-transferring)